MDLDPRLPHPSLGHPAGPEKVPFFIQSVRYSVMQHYLKTWIQKYLHGGMDGRVTLPDNPDLLPNTADDSHL